MVDAWENKITKTWEEESSWSPTHDTTQFSVSEQEQEQTLINGFQKNIALDKSENSWEESPNLDGKGEFSGTKYEYPLRPYTEDCSFYLRTGCCKFGFHCKFNHPVKRGFQGVKEKERRGFVEQRGQIRCKLSAALSTHLKGNLVFYPVHFYRRIGGCKRGEACRFNHSMGNSEIPKQEHNAFVLPTKLYHLSAGGCKYGDTCRYNHSQERDKLLKYIKKSEKAPLDLNFLGLPIRMQEKDCPFYMRNGSCAYGVNCRYHHPDPVTTGGSDQFNATPADVILAGPSSGTYDRLQLKEGSTFFPPPARTKLPFSSPTVGNLMKTADTSTYLQQFKEFPERPGEPECDYFMKTGRCKYRSDCKFHHPKRRGSEQYVCA